MTGLGAAQERGSDRLCRHMAGGLVDDALADQGRDLGRGIGLQRGEARQCLDDMVVYGASGKRAGAAEADDLDVDEPLACRCSHRCVVDAELCRGLWSVGVDDDVGVVEEALQDLLPFGPQQIERDRTFAAIEVGEVGGHAAAPGPGAADLVTA